MGYSLLNHSYHIRGRTQEQEADEIVDHLEPSCLRSQDPFSLPASPIALAFSALLPCAKAFSRSRGFLLLTTHLLHMPTMSSLCETCGKRRGASGSTRCTCNDAPPGYFSRFISRVFSREAGCETIHAGTAMAGAWPEEQITQDHLEGSTTVSSTLESDQELKQPTSQPPADLATAESTVPYSRGL